MGTAAARAEDDPEALIHRGVELRRQGDDQQAETLIRRAYELAPSPHAEAQLGLVELALNRTLDAETHLSEALATNDPWVSSHRDILETTRAKLRKQLACVQILGAPPGAMVARANKPPTPVPADGNVWVAPGAVALRVDAPSWPSTAFSRNLAAGETENLKMTPPVAAQSPVATAAEPSERPEHGLAAPEPDRGHTLRVAGIAAASVGVAAVVGGVVLRQIATSKLDAIGDEANAHQPYDESNGNWQTFEHAGMGLLIGGAAAVVGGGALYFAGHEERPSGAPLSITVGPRAQTIGLAGTF